MMFGLTLAVIVETSVAILLATTIGYCVLLNQRLRKLHADGDSLRAMIGDLMQATSLANSAVHQLKTAAVEADAVLSGRLEEAEKFGVELANHITAGQLIVDKLAKISSATRPAAPPLVDNNFTENNKVQSALQQLAMRQRVRGNAA